MKKIVYYHVADLPGWEGIVSDQLSKMSESGLLEAATEVKICVAGNLDHFAEAEKAMAEYTNVSFVQVAPGPEWHEYPTLEYLRQEAEATNEEYYILYCHTKGISKLTEVPLIHWREFLDYFMIERWEECVAKLDEGMDIATVNWVDGKGPTHAHFQGNTWWVRASYVRKLDPLPHPSSIPWGQVSPYIHVRYDPGNYKFDYEAWSCSKQPQFAIMHDSPGIVPPCNFHYLNPYPRELYATS